MCFDRSVKRINKIREYGREEFFVLDCLKDEIPECDVLITTCLFYHYLKGMIPILLEKLSKNVHKKIILLAPNGAVQKELYGDHAYHPIPDEILLEAEKQGLVFEEHYWMKDRIPSTGEWNDKGVFILVLSKKELNLQFFENYK